MSIKFIILVKHYNSWGRLTEQFPGAFTPCIQFSLLSDCCGVSRSTEYLHYPLTGESIYRLRCQHRTSEENRKYTYWLVPITIPADMIWCCGVKLPYKCTSFMPLNLIINVFWFLQTIETQPQNMWASETGVSMIRTNSVLPCPSWPLADDSSPDPHERTAPSEVRAR